MKTTNLLLLAGAAFLLYRKSQDGHWLWEKGGGAPAQPQRDPAQRKALRRANKGRRASGAVGANRTAFEFSPSVDISGGGADLHQSVLW